MGITAVVIEKPSTAVVGNDRRIHEVAHECESTEEALKWLDERADPEVYSIVNYVRRGIEVKVETVRKATVSGGVSTRVKSTTATPTTSTQGKGKKNDPAPTTDKPA